MINPLFKKMCEQAECFQHDYADKSKSDKVYIPRLSKLVEIAENDIPKKEDEPKNHVVYNTLLSTVGFYEQYLWESDIREEDFCLEQLYFLNIMREIYGLKWINLLQCFIRKDESMIDYCIRTNTALYAITTNPSDVGMVTFKCFTDLDEALKIKPDISVIKRWYVTDLSKIHRPATHVYNTIEGKWYPLTYKPKNWLELDKKKGAE